MEGIISDTVRDLSQDQPLRKIEQPETYERLQEVIDKLALVIDHEEEKEGRDMKVFTLKLDDPAGNSFVETIGGLNDPKWSKREYRRDREQDEQLGLAHEDEDDVKSAYPEEVLSFPSTCGLCGSAQETLMKTVNIPHFKVSRRLSFNS